MELLHLLTKETKLLSLILWKSKNQYRRQLFYRQLSKLRALLCKFDICDYEYLIKSHDIDSIVQLGATIEIIEDHVIYTYGIMKVFVKQQQLLPLTISCLGVLARFHTLLTALKDGLMTHYDDIKTLKPSGTGDDIDDIFSALD